MATFTGTSGSDVFTGGSGADTFNLLTNVTGADRVDGGAGVDELKLSYASLPGSYRLYSTIAAAGGSFNGQINGAAGNYVTFSNIEKLSVTFGGGDDYVYADAAPLAAGGQLTLKGGDGFDVLDIDVSSVGSTTFTVAATGAISSNRGSFATFEQFRMLLGNGTNKVTTGAGDDAITGGTGKDTIDAGAGDDTLGGGTGINVLKGGAGKDNIFSTGSDTVDGGDGRDHWSGDYRTTTSSLAFAYDGATGRGSLTGGTTLAGIEGVTLFAGAGNDTLRVGNLTGFNHLDAGEGRDTLTYTVATGADYYSYGNVLQANGAGGFDGRLGNASGYTDVRGIEHVDAALGGDDNTLFVDLAPLLRGATVRVDGQGGYDRLSLGLQSFGDTRFTVAADGTITSTIAGATFLNVEQFGLDLGNGTNVVVTGDGNDTVVGGSGADTIDAGAGADTLHGGGGVNALKGGAGGDNILSAGGIDTIDGGADDDLWQGDYGAATASLAFDYDAATGAGTLTGGTTLRGIERAYLIAGAGNDSVTLRHLVGENRVDGGAGVDTLTYTAAGQLRTLGAAETLGSNGSGGFTGRIGVTAGPDWSAGMLAIANVEKLDLTLSDEDNVIDVDAAPLRAGATLALDGGLGFDTLRLDLSAHTGIEFAVAASGKVTDNIAGGSFAGFEQYDLVLGNGTNKVAGSFFSDTIRGGSGSDTLSGGDGDDVLHGGTGTNTLKGGTGNDLLYSTGGKNTIDGGEGDDRWYGDYGAATGKLVFNFNATTQRANLTGGTTLVGIEAIELTTGSGGDSFSLIGDYRGTFDAGTGIDTLTTNQAGRIGVYDIDTIVSDGAGGFSATATGGYYGAFRHFERLKLTLSDDNNDLTVDAASLAQGATLSLDGGGGADVLRLDLSALIHTRFAVGSNNVVTDNIAGAGFVGFETYDLTLGNGNNVVTTGAGNDIIRGGNGDDVLDGGGGYNTLYGGGGTNTLIAGALDADFHSTGGIDTVKGGAGYNHWTGDYGSSSADLAFRYDAATDSGSLTGGTTLSRVQTVRLTTGSGDDSFVITGRPDNAHVDGGAGDDTLRVDQSGQAGYASGSIGATLDGGFNGYFTTVGFANVEHVDATLSDGDEYLYVDLLPLGAGATLRLDGGVGTDRLALDLSTLNGVTFSVAGNGVLTETIAGADFLNFEAYDLYFGAGGDTVSTGAGNDNISGGDGADRLSGGLGNDVLTGGGGSDRFVFDTALGRTNVDRIADFSVADDAIWLDDAIFIGAGASGTLSTSAFFVGTAAHDADDRIIYDSATGDLLYDPDGTGSAAAVAFAHIGVGLSVTSGSFFLF